MAYERVRFVIVMTTKFDHVGRHLNNHMPKHTKCVIRACHGLFHVSTHDLVIWKGEINDHHTSCQQNKSEWIGKGAMIASS